MAITIQQPGMAQLYGGAAKSVAEKKRAREREQQAIRRQEQQARKQEIQASFQYKTAMRQQDMAIDLQMSERAKMWEIEKMELRSRMDFQREEQQRQRKLDSADNAIQQIDKEVLAGRMTEQEAYPIKQKLEISKLGVNIPMGAFEGKEEAGLPWYMRETYKDFPEAQAIRERTIAGRVDPTQQLIQRFLTGGESERETEAVTGAAAPIYAVNRTTGERIVSYDNGETWKSVGEEVIEKPATRKPKLKPYGTVYEEWL